MNLFDVYPLFDIEIDRGNGCYVYDRRSEEQTSELQSLRRISYAGFFLKKKTHK